jgi:hypothetical protein
MCKFNYPGVSRGVAITVKLRVLASERASERALSHLTLERLCVLHKFELKLIQYGAIIVKQNGLNNKIHSNLSSWPVLYYHNNALAGKNETSRRALMATLCAKSTSVVRSWCAGRYRILCVECNKPLCALRALADGSDAFA